MALINWIAERIFLPGSDFLLKENITADLRFLKRSQFWSKSDLKAFQNEKLRQLIIHAYNSVPYYKDLFNKLHLVPADINAIDDLEKLPILTKAEIKQQGINKFTSTSITRKNLVNASSSGSTGEPLFYYTTKEAYSMNIAANIRGWYWMDFRLGDKFVKLSQNPRGNPIKKLQDKVSRNLYLATNPLNENNFKYILTKIEEYKPRFIRSYPDPLLFLARYKQKHSEFTFQPHAIATTGNTLFPETRDEIELAFGCKIYDAYSCEGNSNVSECPTHDGYHSAEEYGISEIISEKGLRISAGIGRLISTDLHNLAHPFIRFDTQDLVEISPDPCNCGRELLKIKRIIGRDNDVITTLSGQKFIVHNFTGFFQTDAPEVNRSIDQFQVIKTREGKVIFNLVVNNKYNDFVKDYILTYWESQLQAPVIINIVDEIPLTNSGKRRFIINEA